MGWAPAGTCLSAGPGLLQAGLPRQRDEWPKVCKVRPLECNHLTLGKKGRSWQNGAGGERIPGAVSGYARFQDGAGVWLLRVEPRGCRVGWMVFSESSCLPGTLESDLIGK
uniref:Uncharacterized protein n=1 Tax=Rangifer tarandus platyrhynchus TaxID=3082113 RepID=A0ACB0FNA3_RANTA|nr:unnamed protein product [Rangifer tarandus platyrhynchus]